MDAEAFAEHLSYPQGRGHVPAGAVTGSAGGAACGDLIRLDLTIAGDRVADAGFEASGCGSIVAAGSAAVALVRGTGLLDAARIGAGDVSAELGGLSPGKLHAAELAADALHVALGAAVAASGAVPAAAGRTLVAMSGGVDSAVAALLVQRGGREAVAVTLELWRDPANDAEASCCSAHAVRLARSVAHRMGLPHFTLDLRQAFAAGVVAPFLADHAAGLTPNPCVRCNGEVRLDAMLDFADRLGAADLATGHYARHAPGGLLRVAADPAKDQSYMLAALAPASVARMRFPLGELTKPEVRELARAAGMPVADKRDSQDLCFLAGTGKSAFLARHGGLRERPGAIVDRDRPHGRPPPRAAPVHDRPAQGPRRRRRGRAALRAEQGPRGEHGDGRDARRAGDDGGRRARRGPAPAERRGRPGQAALPHDAAGVPRGARRRRPPRAAPGRAGRRRRAGAGRLPDARRRDRRARRHRVVTRCHAATVAASAISPRRIIASNPATGKRSQRRSCSVASGAGGPGSSPVASHTSKRWSDIP